MAKSSEQNSSLADLGEALTKLVGLVSFIGAYMYFDDIDVDFLLHLVLSFGIAILAMIVAGLILIIVLRPFLRPKSAVEATFEFDTTKRSNRETASEFEYEVAGLINQLTGKRTQVVGGAGDEGIDIKVLDDDDRLVGIVQCKKVDRNKAVYPAYIRDLNTVRHYHHVNTAYLVSTGYFTEKSQELAKSLGVKLIDGNALRQIRKRAMEAS